MAPTQATGPGVREVSSNFSLPWDGPALELARSHEPRPRRSAPQVSKHAEAPGRGLSFIALTCQCAERAGTGLLLGARLPRRRSHERSHPDHAALRAGLTLHLQARQAESALLRNRPTRDWSPTRLRHLRHRLRGRRRMDQRGNAVGPRSRRSLSWRVSPAPRSPGSSTASRGSRARPASRLSGRRRGWATCPTARPGAW